jgi:hypothetical protein
MRPCVTQPCPLCDRGIGAQLRIVLSVYDLKLRAVCLIEVAQPAALQIRMLCEAAGHVRGLVLELRHEADRQRGRIIVQAPDRSHPNVPDPLPVGANCRTALAETWKRVARKESGGAASRRE